LGYLIFDKQGALYGTTQSGGLTNNLNWWPGTVFKLTPPTSSGGQWKETVLYRFGPIDGAAPSAGLIFDSQGALYGTTSAGGDVGHRGARPQGTVFKLTPPSSAHGKWTETVLTKFIGTSIYSPTCTLLFDSKGALYGTTQGVYPSASGYFQGSVFQLTPPAPVAGNWQLNVLYEFSTPHGSGGTPKAGLITGADGAFYGTLSEAGVSGSGGGVFRLQLP